MIVPNARPGQNEKKTRSLIEKHLIIDEVCLVGVRGYYRDTMGTPGVNDLGLYDDAIFLVAPDCHVSFNANTDPSFRRKRMANLKAGLWKYRIGKHKNYKALVQAGPVTVARDEVGDDAGWFGINIHRGGYKSTGSLGCQTIYPPQWEAFISLVETKMKQYQQKVIPYLLLENSRG